MTNKIEVTQADGDRAMRILNHAFRNTDVEVSGECFDDMVKELAAHRTRNDAQVQGLVDALERIETATRNEVRAGDKGYVSRYGLNGVARAALDARGLEIREKGQ